MSMISVSGQLFANDIEQLHKAGVKTIINYRYRMTIDNVIIAGDTAKAHVISTETWQKNGQTNTLTTTAKATFGQSNNNTVLLRSVAQVALD